MFSLELPHRGNSYVFTQYTIFIIKRKSPQIILNLQLCEFSKRLKNKFETAVVNELSVFEPLKFNCTVNSLYLEHSKCPLLSKNIVLRLSSSFPHLFHVLKK